MATPRLTNRRLPNPRFGAQMPEDDAAKDHPVLIDADNIPFFSATTTGGRRVPERFEDETG